MDAQNAADSTQTKPLAGASNHKDQPTSGNKHDFSASTVRVDSKDHETNDSLSDPDDRDSDAETIVLPGKDGHSPSKVRKVRQEDKSDGDRDIVNGARHAEVRNHDGANHGSRSVTGGGSRIGLPGEPRKRRISASNEKRGDTSNRAKDSSSGLTSAPASPPQSRRRRQSASSQSSQSDTDRQVNRGTTLRDKLKTGERLVPSKRKPHREDSEDDENTRKPRRQRLSGSGHDITRSARDRDPRSNATKHDSVNRSSSPPPRSHRRSTSQLPSHPNGSLKKKRVPAPIHTDPFSDDSSASGSPRPRHTRTKSLATPAANDLVMSPAKTMPSHKKHLDAHGQTYLARACARGEYDSAKTRLSERPEDLNVADYAGNTPLQIAAIHGCEDIVKLLVDAGCNLDCVNYDKDTPLLDAVDNGHLAVVKLLLDAGVNPRKANVNGEEPIDRVTDDMDDAEEIRAAIMEAKKRFGGRTKTSEEGNSHLENTDTRDSNAPESPRRSPAMATATHHSRRAGTVRSTKTRNDLLYMPLDEKTLRQAAGRGDEETVARVLQVKDGFGDAESMVAAARGGHEPVIQLLLGIGGAQADPEPVTSQPPEFATPMLAAIGQENIKVLELLLNQQGFDPTRRFKGETYYEIARRRRGTNWKEEEEMLKNAYDSYKTSNKSKAKSPGRRERDRDRDRDRDEKRTRREDKGELRGLKHTNSSPPRDIEPRKKAHSAKLTSPREKRKFEPHGTIIASEERLAPVRQKEERHTSIHVSDRELSPSTIYKPIKAKRAESDVAAMSSEGEAVKPRRKLVSKGVLRGEREKQRRSSIASNGSSFRDPPSPHEARHDETADKTKLSEKYHDRAKALKRDESRDRLGSPNDATAKRHRNSPTPDRPSNTGKDEGEGPSKRRRLEGGNPERRQKPSSTPDGQRRNSSSAPDPAKPPKAAPKKEQSDVKGNSHEKMSHTEPIPEADDGSSVHIKSEDHDVEMPDIETHKAALSTTRHGDADEERKKRKAAQQAQEDEERRRIEQEERKQADEKRKRKRQEEEEARRRDEEKKRAAEQRKQEEAARLKREEEAQEKLRQAEEKARLEAAEKAKREAVEKQRLEEEKRRAEEEQARRAEEERRRKEREAQEEARRKQEEEERERRERAQKEEAERKQAAREAELKRIREEQDRIRLEKLPPLLRWLDTCENPKTASATEGLRTIQGVRYDCIRPEANRTAEGREQWVLNTHVALLLGEKDLNLSRYAAWERVSAGHLAKLTLWRTDAGLYALTDDKVLDLGRQLPGYYGTEKPSELGPETRQRLRREAWERFKRTDLFFVKLSDLLYTVPNIPHLKHVKLAVMYRELIETETQAHMWRSTQKWKQDPDANRFGGYFAPRNKYYVNGIAVDEDRPIPTETSKTPFPEKRVPRKGLLQVLPGDPDYARVCIEQGLQHLLPGHKSPSLANGVHTPPGSNAEAPLASALPSENTDSKEYNSPERAAHSPANGSLTNGINGSG